MLYLFILIKIRKKDAAAVRAKKNKGIPITICTSKQNSNTLLIRAATLKYSVSRNGFKSNLDYYITTIRKNHNQNRSLLNYNRI
jgi:hypothetical protein